MTNDNDIYTIVRNNDVRAMYDYMRMQMMNVINDASGINDDQRGALRDAMIIATFDCDAFDM